MKKQFRPIALLCLLLSLLLCLTACGLAQNGADATPDDASPAGDAGDTGDTGDTPDDGASGEDVPVDATTAAALEAYRAVLTQLLNDHTLPGTGDLGVDESFDPESNQFAVYDVDGDGRRELVVAYTATFSAAQTLAVYDYDEAAAAVYAELSEYPLITFYDNGTIKADWSHNQGLAGDFWPYSLYQYDAANDVYVCVGMVDAWDKALSAENFPDEVDVSGTGFVYYLMDGSVYAADDPVDAAEYDAWYDSFLGGAQPVELPFTPLTAENIAAMQ